ncbi:MAG: hypothetical protein MI755_16255 [Sphingomonadales bacterium]|nr:hypothetical protein [Sphingomonadales bacterium]
MTDPAVIFRDKIIVPVLRELELCSEAATTLLLGTALHESGGLRYIHQDGGPAMGLYQMEPDTLDDLWTNWLAYRREWRQSLEVYGEVGLEEHDPENLYNARYATATARLQYYRQPERLPSTREDLAYYYKRHWNTSKGRATPQDFLDALDRHGV